MQTTRLAAALYALAVLVVPWQCSASDGAYSCSAFNVDLTGINDIKGASRTVADIEACAVVCEGRPACRWASFVPSSGRCYPKRISADMRLRPMPRQGVNMVIPFSSDISCGLLQVPGTPTRLAPGSDGVLKCFNFGADLNGVGDIPGGRVSAESYDECALICQSRAGCNAATYVESVGFCYLKAVPANAPSAGLQPTAILLVPKGSDLSCEALRTGAPPPSPGSEGCRAENVDWDQIGDIRLSARFLPTEQQCAAYCQTTSGCNAAAYAVSIGYCYPKNVPTSPPPVIFRQDVNLLIPEGSNLSCDLLPTGPVPAPPPVPEVSVKCKVDGADWPDILVIPPSKPARSNEACARICQSTPGCNYAVLVNALRCYPKTLSGSPPQPSYFYDNVTIVIPEGSDLACDVLPPPPPQSS